MTLVQRPRVVVAMMGNHTDDPTLYTKYGYFLESLAQRLPLVDVFDSNLKGLPRLLHALMVLHPNRRQWRQRYYKYPRSFLARSRQASSYITEANGRADVILQINTMFDATWPSSPIPNVIYTDYTGRLSARHPSSGRSPFSSRRREEWIRLERRAYERAAHVCTRSHLVRQSIIDDYGLPPERATVVGGGLNFPAVPEPVNRVPTEAPTVLFVGKDLYRKGGDRLLKAFAMVRTEIPEARLLLITGQSPSADLPLQNVDVIVEPFLSREQLPDFYRRADVFVLPSRLETWGDVVVEAMSFELPCIGIAGHAMQEIIVHEQTGLLVPDGDIAALAGAITRALKDHETRLSWGRTGRDRVLNRFTWDHVVERLAPVIEDAARNSVADYAHSPIRRTAYQG